MRSTFPFCDEHLWRLYYGKENPVGSLRTFEHCDPMDRLSSPILQAPPGVLAEFEGGPAVVVALNMGWDNPMAVR